MAIKLKKFINDKNRGKFLFAAWMILPVLLAISLFFRSYSSVEYYGDLSFELVRVYESIYLDFFFGLADFWVSCFFLSPMFIEKSI